ncbi:DUF401 family protein [Candidatus Dependentiae bacterium]|nr:DUF401 family protein [Candidatus Dependentiae bacterium]
MLEFLRILYIILFSGTVIFLISRKKFPVGITILFISIGILVYLAVPLDIIRKILFQTFQNYLMYKLMVVIFLILFFSKLLKEIGLLDEAVFVLEKSFNNKSKILPVFPALIGLLPMPGGAMFSAPMVRSITNNMEIRNEDKTFINYWFRHMWEPILPLYPGFILQLELVIAVTNHSNAILRILLWQLPITILIFLGGYIFKLRSFSKKQSNNNTLNLKNIYSLLKKIWSILLLIFLVIFFNRIDFALLIACVTILTALIYFKKLSTELIFKILKDSLSVMIVVLIFAVFFFQSTMEGTGVLNEISFFLSNSGIPIAIVIFVIPLIIGVLSGLTITFIAITFPLIIPLISTPEFSYNLIALAFLGGYFGVLLSPVHLCLVLTNEYFESHLNKVYFLLFKSMLLAGIYGIFLSLI